VIRNLMIVVGVCIICVLLGYALVAIMKPQSHTITVAKQGQPMADFSFTDIDGNDHDFTDFKGRHVLVHFWASWCAPCVAEFPDLVKMAEKNADNVVVLAFSWDKKKEPMDRFLSKNVKNIPNNMIIIQKDSQKIAQDMFGTFQLPETYVYLPDGTLKSKIVGAYAEWDDEVF